MAIDPGWSEVTAVVTDWAPVPQIRVTGGVGWGSMRWGSDPWGGTSGTASDPTAITWSEVTAGSMTWTEVT